MKTSVIAMILTSACLMLAAPGCSSSGSGPGTSYQTADDLPRRNTELAKKLNAEALEEIAEQRFDDAEPKLKAALEADVTYGPAHNNLGKVYYHQNKLYLAAWEFQYAAKLMPDHPDPKNNLGLVLEAAGKLDEAIAQYEQAKELGPDGAELIANLARAKVRRGDRDAETRDLLEEVVFKDARPQWVNWAKEKLAVMPLGQPTRAGTEPPGQER